MQPRRSSNVPWETHVVAHGGGWWLRFNYDASGRRYWHLTWAPLGMAEAMATGRGLLRMLWDARRLPSLCDAARMRYAALQAEDSRRRILEARG